MEIFVGLDLLGDIHSSPRLIVLGKTKDFTFYISALGCERKGGRRKKAEGGPFCIISLYQCAHLLYSIVPLFFYLNICCLSFFLFSSWLYRDHAEGWLAFFYFLSFFYLKLLDKLGAMRELHLVSFPIRLLSASSSSSFNNRGK